MRLVVRKAQRVLGNEFAVDRAVFDEHFGDAFERRPRFDFKAAPLLSWHMFKQSGRLFVPNSRTKNW